MFDISFSELMVIGAIALVVIGPSRLPKVARTVGHLMGRAQRYVNNVKADIQREVELDELRKFKEQMSDAARDVQSSFKEGEAALRDTEKSLREQAREVESLAKGGTGEAGTQTAALDKPAAQDAGAADSQAAPQDAPPAEPPQRPGPWAQAEPAADEPSSSSTGKTT